MYSSDFILLEIDPSRIFPVLSSIDNIYPFCFRDHQMAFRAVEQCVISSISSFIPGAHRTDILLATEYRLIFGYLVVLYGFIARKLGTLELLENSDYLSAVDGENSGWRDCSDGQMGIEAVSAS
jgi:hypothetical protein